MKKLLFAAAVLFFSVVAQAQTNGNFGIKAGYAHLTAKADYMGVSASVSDDGFFVGATSEFGLSSVFAIQPEVLYANVQDYGFLYVPVMAKYYVAPKFSLQAGPQMNFSLDAEEGENSFGLDAAFGAGYNISDNFFIDARYGLELTNRFSESDPDFGDVKGKYNTLMIGVGYMF